MAQNCLKPTTPSHSTGVQTHGWCHSVGNQMLTYVKNVTIDKICSNHIFA